MTLAFDRLESAFRSPIRPVLHSAARVVQEMGKSRAAAYSLRGYVVDEDSHPEALVDGGYTNASDIASSEADQSEAEGYRIQLSASWSRPCYAM